MRAVLAATSAPRTASREHAAFRDPRETRPPSRTEGVNDAAWRVNEPRVKDPRKEGRKEGPSSSSLSYFLLTPLPA